MVVTSIISSSPRSGRIALHARSRRCLVRGILEDGEDAFKRGDGVDGESGDERGLFEVLFREEEIGESGLARRACDRERAEDRPYRAVERELARKELSLRVEPRLL